jgi:hypothetical protein
MPPDPLTNEAIDALRLSIAQTAEALELSIDAVRRLVADRYIDATPDSQSGRGGYLRIAGSDATFIPLAHKLREHHIDFHVFANTLRSRLVSFAPSDDVAIVLRNDEAFVYPLIGFDLEHALKTTDSIYLQRFNRDDAYEKLRLRLPPILERTRERGRPRVDPRALEEALDTTSDLGDDTTSQADLSTLIGPRGKAPWQRD